MLLPRAGRRDAQPSCPAGVDSGVWTPWKERCHGRPRPLGLSAARVVLQQQHVELSVGFQAVDVGIHGAPGEGGGGAYGEGRGG